MAICLKTKSIRRVRVIEKRINKLWRSRLVERVVSLFRPRFLLFNSWKPIAERHRRQLNEIFIFQTPISKTNDMD